MSLEWKNGLAVYFMKTHNMLHSCYEKSEFYNTLFLSKQSVKPPPSAKHFHAINLIN